MKNKSKFKIKGKIQSWLISENNEIKTLFVRDYLSYKSNLTPNEYLNDIASLGKGLTPNLELKYIALSTAYDPPQKTTGLELELLRVEPLETITQINNKLVIEAKFETGSTAKGEIASVTDLKTFTLSSATGFNIGDRIAVKVTGITTKEERKITNKSGNIITVHQDFSALPETGVDKCLQMISRLHLVYGASATGTVNTGSPASLAQLITAKLSTDTIYTRHEIEYIGS